MAAVIGNASGDAQSTAPGYADALQRAREIASKIQPENPGPMGDYSNKRPLEDSGEHSDEPGAKKLASQNDLNITLGSMQQQVGAAGGRVPITENIHLPDKLVGLIIGKGGENITKLQAQTGCRIQIAQECAENNERPCTLTGTPEQIATCRATLQEVIKNANLGGSMNNNVAGIEEMSGNGAQTVIQLMIPPDKCGLIIGKGGDTIKSLQQNIGVKMMLIQDTTQNTGLDKPLRISGDPMKVQQAKQAVEQLMAQRDAQLAAGRQGGGGGGGGGGGMGGMNRNFDQHHGGNAGQANRVSIPVPKSAVGVVIGKGGEMITRIQNETRTRVQFKQEEDDPNIQYRMCMVSGTPEGVQEAIARVNELVQSVQEHDNGGRTGGGAGGRSGGFGQWDNPGMSHNRSGPGINTVEYSVPANKTGLVIGKGGETIKNINLQSQAHVEIQRNPPPGSDPNFKTFVIKGTIDQIAHAQQLIQEKVDGGPGRGPMRHNMGPPAMGHPGPMQGPPGGGPPGGFVPPPQAGFGGPPPGPGFGGPPQVPPAPTQPPHQPFPGQQPWGAPGQFQWPGAPQPNGAAPPDPHKPTDPNAAATWASFYQYYQSQGQQPAQAAASATAAAAQYPPAAPAAAAAAQPAAAPAAQPDYTKAWEEYYKKQAEAAAAAAAAPTSAPQATTSPADYSAAWAEYYRQFSQYYQQAQVASATPGQ